MKRKIIFKNIVLLVIVFVIVLIFIFQGNKDKRSPVVVLPAPPTTESLSESEFGTGYPKTIIIPSVEVRARVENVGVTESGNMDVPEDYDDVGWFRHGARPGSPGSAVIAGHLDTGRGQPALFYNLSGIKIGDEVFIEDDTGEVLRFVVSGYRLVDYENPPDDLLREIFSTEGEKSRLILITCDGDWVPEEKTYTSRFIVFADLVV